MTSLYPNSNKIRHPFLGYKQSKKTRKQISKTLTGRKLSKVHRLKCIKHLKSLGPPTKEIRLKMSISRKKYLKKHPQYPSEATKQKIRIARLKQIIPTKDTKIEKIVQQELKNRKIKFKKHVNLIGQPDIFIEPNICIFVDGDYWHANPSIYSGNHKFVGNRIAKEIWSKDHKLKKELIKNNFKVLRFWETDIYKNISSIGDRIQSIISHD